MYHPARVYDEKAYEWNRAVGPAGNLGGVDPAHVARLCDKYGIPWFTSAWPYSSGLKAYCADDELWSNIIQQSK